MLPVYMQCTSVLGQVHYIYCMLSPPPSQYLPHQQIQAAVQEAGAREGPDGQRETGGHGTYMCNTCIYILSCVRVHCSSVCLQLSEELKCIMLACTSMVYMYMCLYLTWLCVLQEQCEDAQRQLHSQTERGEPQWSQASASGNLHLSV